MMSLMRLNLHDDGFGADKVGDDNLTMVVGESLSRISPCLRGILDGS